MRRFLVLLAVLSALVPHPSAAQPRTLCFDVPGITSCLQGRFLEYWSSNGGLAVFGYPLTNQVPDPRPAGPITVQLFERARFELHPDQPRPRDVLLDRLGAARLQQLGRTWAAEPPGHPAAGCSWWPQTQHALCPPFKQFWETHGLTARQLSRREQSLGLFGLPLTEARLEIQTGGVPVLTQWFERARLEWRPGHGITLGLLGHELQQGTVPHARPLDAAIVDLDQFWSRAFADRRWPYQSLHAVVQYDHVLETPCGHVEPTYELLFYCPADIAIYLHRGRIDQEVRSFGALAAVTIIAHEWGHHIQELRRAASPSSRERELSADCLAGAYMGDAQGRGVRGMETLRPALQSLEHAGDPPGTHRDDPRAHGTGAERVAAFLAGVQFGMEHCSVRDARGFDHIGERDARDVVRRWKRWTSSGAAGERASARDGTWREHSCRFAPRCTISPVSSPGAPGAA